MNYSTRARVLAFEGVRELSVDIDGKVATSGDANGQNLNEVALENLEIAADEATEIPWQRELARRRAYEGTAHQALTAEEWEQIPGEYESWSEPTDEEIEADSEEIEADEVDEDSEIEDDVQAGPAQTVSHWERVGESTEMLERHVLVRGFGFAIDSLITPWGNPMRAEYLAVVTAACRAARELADMAGKGEVVKMIGWKGELPSKLSGFGVDVLFRNAGILQGAVEAIKASRKRETEAKAKVKPGLVLPARQSTPRVMTPATQLVKPEGSDPFGRISTASGLAFRCVCGCNVPVLESVAQVPPIGAMRDRMNGNRVGSKDLWRHAFGDRCILRFGRGYSLKEKMRQMMDEELKREAASRTMRPRFGDVGNGGATRVGKTARDAALKAANK